MVAVGKKGKLAIAGSFALLGLIFAAIYGLIAVQLGNKNTLSYLVLRPCVGPNSSYEMEPVSGINREIKSVPAVDGSKLNAWLYRRTGSDRITIVNHGNAGDISNRVYIASALARSGCSVLLYDYRGYGISSGTPSLDGILQDGLTIYDFVHGRLGYPANKIMLYGESVGCAVTLNTAKQRPCLGLVLQSGFASLPSVGRNLFPVLWLFPDFVVAEPHLDNAALVREIHVPVLISHGIKDKAVSFHDSERLFASANQPRQLVLLPSCGHNDMGVYDSELFNVSLDRFVESLKN